jgi:diphosphate-dependent phosphofructokinase
LESENILAAHHAECPFSHFIATVLNISDLMSLGSGRHKIETPQQFADSLDNCTNLDLDGLVVIGGDDSNTNACLLAEYFASKTAKTKVIGCPKTIDGDLKNEHIPVSFGFDTATKVYSEAIGNLCSDVISSKEYYHFVRLMGRSASHIALECALRTQINCVLIGEEVEAKKQTLSQVTSQVADIICQRSELGKNYGVVLVPEGLIEFIPEMSVLISEVNELLAKPFQGEIRSYV